MKLNKNTIYNITFLFFIALSSCNVINPEEKIPAYINIAAINLETDEATQGAATKNISDAWIYIDDQFIGCFELPTTFPVLETGEVNLKVRAGIKNNGAVAQRLDYSFYKFYEINTTLIGDSVYSINPTVEYFDNIEFEWLEDFDSPNTTLEPTEESNNLLTTSDPDLILSGSSSAKIELNSSEEFFYGLSPEMSFNILGNNIYLEMDYKSTAFIEVRVISYLPGEFEENALIILFPKEQWNKIYLEIGSEINKYPNASHYQIAILSYNLEGEENSVTYLDNIKVIHPG